jgi:hypothetical protein
MDNTISRWRRSAIVIVGFCVGAAAYAANPVADEKIAVAQASIARAEQSGAPQFAPVELATARDKLARAQKANADRDVKPAALWAEQADIDAQVAEATATLQHSQTAAAEFDANMQALRNQAMQTAAQPAQ